MAVKIQVKRGAKAGLPTLAPGEWGLATDTREVFIGSGSGNIPVATLDNNGKIPSGNLNISGYVPVSRTVNGKALTENISLAASDVGAVPTGRTVNGKSLNSNISLSASDVGAAPQYTYGTTDLTAGTSTLATGTLYFVYE